MICVTCLAMAYSFHRPSWPTSRVRAPARLHPACLVASCGAPIPLAAITAALPPTKLQLVWGVTLHSGCGMHHTKLALCNPMGLLGCLHAGCGAVGVSGCPYSARRNSAPPVPARILQRRQAMRCQ